ncbi:hypothetical protein D3C72_2254870 [compost metagenome]
MVSCKHNSVGNSTVMQISDNMRAFRTKLVSQAKQSQYPMAVCSQNDCESFFFKTIKVLHDLHTG